MLSVANISLPGGPYYAQEHANTLANPKAASPLLVSQYDGVCCLCII